MCVFKQKSAYEMRISDWSSDVCSSELRGTGSPRPRPARYCLARDGLSIHDGGESVGPARRLAARPAVGRQEGGGDAPVGQRLSPAKDALRDHNAGAAHRLYGADDEQVVVEFRGAAVLDRKSTRLNSSH